MDYEKLVAEMDIDTLRKSLLENSDPDGPCIEDDLMQDAATALSTLQAENKRLRVELEQVKRCLEIVEHQREAAIDDMTALMAGQCCDLCAVEYCNDRGKTEMCTAFKWRGTKEG